ncbi:AraC family transcriptional regulator [Paenibacillus sp. GYB003]|uniref:AraC family transcriptional regulator n=1 Tax=Paenibacillus sp. GYB003 TaxID=2994392 RepID=UPI002F9694CD
MHRNEDDRERPQRYGSLDEMWPRLRGADLLGGGGMEQRLVDTHVLLLPKTGGGRLTLDLHEYTVKPDTAFFARPGQTVGLLAEEADVPALFAFKFELLRCGERSEPFPPRGEAPFYPEKRIGMLGELAFASFRSEDGLERLRAQSAFLELLYWLMRSVRPDSQADSRTALERTKAYMDDHYNESITIEQLARMADISPKYYVDLFKKTYGKSAIDYLTEVRVARAKKLMVASGARLRDIAQQVGYNDEFYFSRKFKKEVGVSPTVYIKSRRRKIAAYTSSALGQLLALNIVPYAAPLHPKWTAYYYKTYRDDIPVHLSAYRYNRDMESNRKALAAAGPDTIVCCDELPPGEKARLERIAPVLAVPYRENGWREQLLLIAEALEATQEAEKRLQSYERKVAAARELLRRELGGERVAAVSLFKQTFYISPTRGIRDMLYRDLKLNAAPESAADRIHVAVTVDGLAELDADRIMLNICQEPETLAHWERLRQSAAWLGLRAVRGNAVCPIPSDPWREYSAYACERMVDDALNRLVYGNRPNGFRKSSMFAAADVDYNRH